MLRGMLGASTVAVALPPLEAMLGSNGAFADDSTARPIFGLFFWANGLPWHAGHGTTQAGNPDLWTPATTGPGYASTPLLAPLAAHQVSVATGLEPHTEVPGSPDGQGDGHMRGFMVAMTGDRPRSEGFDHPTHTLTALRPTLDQYVAQHPEFYGDYPTLFRSLEIGISKVRFHDYGHWDAISYNGPDSQNPPVQDPAQLYAKLFDIPDDLEVLERRASVVDAVLEDAKSLRNRLGPRDKLRLEAHLSHLDEVQRRLELAGASCDTPTPPGATEDLHAKTAIMSDLLAIALACDLTNVFSFQLTAPATDHVFSNLGVPDSLHATCHNGHWERVRAVMEYQMQAFALLLDRLAATTDPTGATLLDRACVFGTSEYGEGWQHGPKEHPIVIAGRANGKLVPGVHFREEGGNISRAHVTVLRALGIETPSFGFNGGETTEHLTGILA
jgi:hypothetical protein